MQEGLSKSKLKEAHEHLDAARQLIVMDFRANASDDPYERMKRKMQLIDDLCPLIHECSQLSMRNAIIPA